MPVGDGCVVSRRDEALSMAFGAARPEQEEPVALTEDRVREIVREELAKAKSDG